MDWMKKPVDGTEYRHLLGFFKKRPTLLVGCGIYMDDLEGIHFFFRKGDSIVERYLSYEELNGRTIKKTLTELANI